MSLHGKNMLGKVLSAEGKLTFQAVNPATGEKLAPAFAQATESEVDRAGQLAADASALRTPGEPGHTVALLEQIAGAIETLGDELIERAAAETGLGEARLTAERTRTTAQLRMFTRLVDEGSWVDARIDRPQPNRKPVAKPDLRRMLVPVGPVAVFGASNFPLAFSIPGGDTASAFAAGCPVVIKAHPAHPGTSELVGQAIREAVAEVGLPEGWFSMLHGAGHEVGMSLVRHPSIRAVGFTGSLAGGRALFDAAVSRADPIPVYAEMGSINPVFLLPGALRDRAPQIAEGLHQSLTLGVGQFCTNPGLVLAIEGEALDRFLVDLRGRVKQTAPGTMLHAGILEGYQQGLERLSRVPGVEMAASSRQGADPAKTQAATVLFVTDANTFQQHAELADEVFGPATLVVVCRDRQQMLAIARGLEGQLSATIHAADEELAEQEELLGVLRSKAGRLVFAGFPTGVEVCQAMHHGGPYPATSNAQFTSVGTAAIQRFARPLCYQNFPEQGLPPELRDKNQRGIRRLIDGQWCKEDV